MPLGHEELMEMEMEMDMKKGLTTEEGGKKSR